MVLLSGGHQASVGDKIPFTLPRLHVLSSQPYLQDKTRLPTLIFLEIKMAVKFHVSVFATPFLMVFGEMTGSVWCTERGAGDSGRQGVS